MDSATNNKWILIENPGEAAAESFTLLGATNKAGTSAIGQFGSGTKFGILACLRKQVNPVIYCGNLCLKFDTESVEFGGKEHKQVLVKFSGKLGDKNISRTEKLSVALNYGNVDWKDNIALSLREFVSNALDEVGGHHEKIRVVVTDDKPRAKAGFTRVYIPFTEDGGNFVKGLGTWFLQFSGKDVNKSGIIRRQDGVARKGLVYRRGVLVRSLAYESVFDYNLNELSLDEARNGSDYSCLYEASKAVLNSGDVEVYKALFSIPSNSYETHLDLNSYELRYTTKEREQHAALWKQAQEELYGDKSVIVHPEHDSSGVVGKGYVPVKVPATVYSACAGSVRTIASILTHDEREGRHIDEIPQISAVKLVDHVWGILERLGATRGEKKPPVYTFTQKLIGGCLTKGYWRNGEVYFNNDILPQEFSAGQLTNELFAVALEELAHHITKATDNSRDFQEFFIQVLTGILR